MILVDASVWIEHFKRPEPQLIALIDQGLVWTHDFTIGEVALGTFKHRAEAIALMHSLDACLTCTLDEVTNFIDCHRLNGQGIGLVDVHLLIACQLHGLKLWTFDRALARAAASLKVTYAPAAGLR